MRKSEANASYYSLSDFIRPANDGKPDYAGLFAITAGNEIQRRIELLRRDGDDYTALLLQSLADRLAEAAAEWLHRQIRREFWGYAPDEPDLDLQSLLSGRYRGIRPAVGYPSLPDHSLFFDWDRALDFSRIGITLTENGAMMPNASVAGLYIAHPDATSGTSMKPSANTMPTKEASPPKRPANGYRYNNRGVLLNSSLPCPVALRGVSVRKYRGGGTQ